MFLYRRKSCPAFHFTAINLRKIYQDIKIRPNPCYALFLEYQSTTSGHIAEIIPINENISDSPEFIAEKKR